MPIPNDSQNIHKYCYFRIMMYTVLVPASQLWHFQNLCQKSQIDYIRCRCVRVFWFFERNVIFFLRCGGESIFFFQYMIYRMLYAQHLFSRSNGDMPLKNEIKLVVSLFSVKIMMKNRMQWKIGPDLMMKKQNHTKLISSSYKWNCAGKKVTTTLAISQYKLLFWIKIIFF